MFSTYALADNYFNPAFLSNDPSAVADLSQFTKSGVQAPGKYLVDVYLNNEMIESRNVDFVRAKNTADETGLTPCLPPAYLESIGVNLRAFPRLKYASSDTQKSLTTEGVTGNTCADFLLMDDTKTTFDFEKLRLNISVPQAAMMNIARGYIPSEQWDQGVNALLLNYNFTGSDSKDHSNNSAKAHEYFLGLNGGLNIGAWRLRDFSTWNYSRSGGKNHNDWEHISTYVQRTIIPLKGQLTAGDSYTSGDVFDSLSFRGVQVASDDNMLPDSLRGFAPTVRGIAKSNAQVTIKQNGYSIYQTYVQPGAFAINDLFPTSSSGDLQVEIKESDGSITAYSLPYSSVPQLQREGRLKYALTAAKYRSNGDQQDDTEFVQATAIQGIANGLTIYGGSQWSEDYRSFALGLGVNLGKFGAVSTDITQAHSVLANDSEHNGQSLRFLYAKSLNNFGTNFQLLGYRYSTSGYYTLADTTYKHMDGYNKDPVDSDNNIERPSWMDYYNLYYTKRGKVQANISQQLQDYGSIFLSVSQQSYWHTDDTDSLIQLGYSGTLKDISYNISYNYSSYKGQDENDQLVALNVSLPLGKWLSPNQDTSANSRRIYANYSMNTDQHGHSTHNVGVNGTLLEDNNLSYSVQQGFGNHGTEASGNTSMNYQGTYSNASVGYNYSGDYSQVNYGISGGVVAHAQGITFSQPLGETNVLIAAPGVSNVKIENNTGVKTDWRGYTVVPYATTYRKNRIALDTNSLGENVDMNDAVVDVVPTQGALVLANFDAKVGHRALLMLTYQGKAVPFGAMVSTEDGKSTAIVGDDGQVYLAGLQERGRATVQWGAGKQCTIQWKMSEQDSKAMVWRENKKCE
nr:fimbrial biogenesis usher protein [Enterobacter ludwigii]